ncbi:MAG: Transcriptional regulator, LysR family [uncultured Caballeronia sp.]|nr:MAG: Transcriptional regulator, LysR family [uncultured Caballeronia sp.]
MPRATIDDEDAFCHACMNDLDLDLDLDLNLIPYLVAIEETRNVSRAAERLGVSQPRSRACRPRSDGCASTATTRCSCVPRAAWS